MTPKERRDMIRSTIESMWNLNPNTRLNGGVAVEQIAQAWEDDVDAAFERGVDAGAIYPGVVRLDDED
jgi:hypothetical protein